MGTSVAGAELAVAVLGGSGLTGIAAAGIRWWTGRKKVRADTFSTVVDALSNRLQGTERRLDQVEVKLDDCEGKHEACEDNLRATNIRLGDAEREIGRLRIGPP